MDVLKLIRNILVAMLALGITTFLTPGMSISGGLIGTLFVASIVIAIIAYLIGTALGGGKAANGTGGFIITAIVLLVAGKLVSGFDVSIIGALIGALIYGIIAAILN